MRRVWRANVDDLDVLLVSFVKLINARDGCKPHRMSRKLGP
jgi:hypothetical protein